MRKGICILMAAVICLCSGCSKEEPITGDFQVTTKQKEEKAEEKTVLTLSMRVPETLNPLLNRDETVDMALKPIYMPFLGIAENGKPEKAVAESWIPSEDGKSLSVQLSEDLVWQDGTPVTASDVVFSFRTILGAEEDSVYKKVTDYVASCTATGANSVQVTFRSSFTGNMAALNFPVISARYYGGQHDPKGDVNMSPMGCGPYRMESYTVASSLLLVPNELYRGKKPSVPQINIRITSGADTDIYSFSQGILDVLVANATDAGKYMTQNTGTEAHAFSSDLYDFIGFNFQGSLFEDKNLRQAVAYLISKKYLWESVYLQYADMTNTPVKPTSWLYEENVAPYNYDPEMAATLVKNAGWIDKDKDGIRERILPNGREEKLQIQILVNEENTARKQIASKLAEELGKIGVFVTIDIQPYEAYTQKFQRGEFDLVVGGWKMPATADLRMFFHTDGAYNYIGYSNEEMDTLLEAACTAAGEGRTLLAYSNLQKKMAEELPYISIAYRQNVLLTSGSVGGEIAPLQSNVYQGIEDWVLQKRKA